MDAKERLLRAELIELDTKLQDPEVFSDKNYPKIAKRRAAVADLVALFDEKAKLLSDQAEAEALKNNPDAELQQMASLELEELDAKIQLNNEKLIAELTPQDPNNERDVIFEIRAAAGGDESSLFAGELYRMYARWAEIHNYKIELISESANEVGGFKEITFALRGVDAYKNLKFEAGVHRVQRVPVTESQGRIHTSTATVTVLPEAEESEIEISPNDLRIDVYRSGGHGGQSVNTTDSAVRITHLPSRPSRVKPGRKIADQKQSQSDERAKGPLAGD